MNFRIAVSILPVAVFYGLTRIADPWQAVLGGFVATTLVFYFTRESRLIGALTAFGFVIVAVSAGIGIFANSEKAYLASGPVSDFLFVGLYLVSIAIGRPLVGGIARELFPAAAGNLPGNAPVFVWLSVIWAGYDVLQGVMRIFLLQELTVGEYLIWSRLLFWPVTATLLGISALWIYRESRRREPFAPAGALNGPEPEAI